MLNFLLDEVMINENNELELELVASRQPRS